MCKDMRENPRWWLGLFIGMIVVGLLVAAVPTGQRMVPPRHSLDATVFEDAALGEPRLFTRGIDPQAAGALVIAFDDGWDRILVGADSVFMYDSLVYWGEPAQGGIRFSLGIIRKYVDTDGHLTSAKLRDLAASGVCIMNHGYLHRDIGKMDRDSLEIEVNRAYDWFLDTLGVEVRGFDYFGGSYYNDKMLAVVAENHDYGTGIFFSTPNQYEVNKGIAFKTWDAAVQKWWRYGGNMLQQSDTLSYVGGTGTWSDSLVSTHALLVPNATWNPYILPVGASVMTGGGTCKSFRYAKALVQLAERNRGCVSIYFHKWDQTWMRTFMDYVKAEVAAGRLRTLTQDEAVDEYVFGQRRSGVNWFPDWGDSCSLAKRTPASFARGNIPDGWHRSPNYGTSSGFLFKPGEAGGGMGAEDFQYVRHPGATAQLAHLEWVPGDCWVLWSCKMSAYQAWTPPTPDSIEVTAYCVSWAPRVGETSTAPSTAGFAKVYTGWNATGVIYENGFAAQETPLANATFAGGFYAQSRWLVPGANVWKEIRCWHYVAEPCMVQALLYFRTAPPASWATNKGLKLEDVLFTVYRRSGFGMAIQQ